VPAFERCWLTLLTSNIIIGVKLLNAEMHGDGYDGFYMFEFVFVRTDTEFSGKQLTIRKGL